MFRCAEIRPDGDVELSEEEVSSFRSQLFNSYLYVRLENVAVIDLFTFDPNSYFVNRFKVGPYYTVVGLTYHFLRCRVPPCPKCSGILKPFVVFFGDNVPKPRVEQVPFQDKNFVVKIFFQFQRPRIVFSNHLRNKTCFNVKYFSLTSTKVNEDYKNLNKG